MKIYFALAALLFLSLAARAQNCIGVVSDLIVSTGYDPVNQTVINDYDMDPMWRLIQTPADPPGWTSNVGGPAISVPLQGAWSYAGSNSKYINAYPTAQALTDNWVQTTTQYIFQREFCVCSQVYGTMVDVTFDLSLNADNWAELYLEDENGNETLLMSQNYVYQTSNFQNNPTELDTTIQLMTGTYKLNLHHRNKLVVMGVNLDGKIYSNGVLSNSECVPKGIIGGYSREDGNQNNNIDDTDPKSNGWTIELRNSANTLLSTATTDNNGFYFFMDLDPGTYTVTAVPPSGWSVIVPQSYSYTAVVDKNVVNVKSFLGVPDPNANPAPEPSEEPHCVVEVPNIFTPNGDQINDKFYFSMDCNLPIEGKIMNRWGNVVYETTDVKEGWDGTYKGNPIPEGAYFYTVTVQYEDGEHETYTGYLQIVR